MIVQAAALLPIAPLILLPFLIVFFIAVFPLWCVAMLVLVIVRGLMRLVLRRADHPAVAKVDRAFKWVKSFGGLIDWVGGTAAGKSEM
jgi:hypothetical protein